jgi:hypothetical protein
MFVANAESGKVDTASLGPQAQLLAGPSVHAASIPALKARIEKLDSKLNFNVLGGMDVLQAIALYGVTEDNTMHPLGCEHLELHRSGFVSPLMCQEGTGLNRFARSLAKADDVIDSGRRPPLAPRVRCVLFLGPEVFVAVPTPPWTSHRYISHG